MVITVGVGAARAVQKAGRAWPEWIHWWRVARQPWQSIAGPDKEIFGYLPGFAAIMKAVFAVPPPTRAYLFATLNALFCVGILVILRAWYWRSDRRIHLALATMTAVTLYMSVQNNQVVAPSMLLALVAFGLIMRSAWFGSFALACAILIKPLPATLFLLLTLIQRFRFALVAGVVTLAVSVASLAMTEGLDISVDAHRGFPAQLRAQDPNRTLTEGVRPITYSDNQSVSAAIARLGPWIGNVSALVLNRLVFWGSLLLASYLSFAAARRGVSPVVILAMWLAWTIFATPYCRYYYTLFLLPAWWLFWPKGSPREHPARVHAALWCLALLPIATRTEYFGPYVLLSVMTFAWSAIHCYREIGAQAGPGRESVAK
ncbi:MAG: glycosyltransferase 87 family protein [Planctomycetota bacterium]